MALVASFHAFLAVRVLAEEPENCDYDSTEGDEEHLSPLQLAFVELCHNDLAASNVDKCASRNAQEGDIYDRVALLNRHSDGDADGSDDREDGKEQDDLFQAVASAS